MHGPVVTVNMAGTEVPSEANYGGCVAVMDGMTAAGSCGNQVNNFNDCAVTECAQISQTVLGCSDFSTDGPMTQACIQYAFTTGACMADRFSMACFNEINADGGADGPCLGTFNALLTLWCGP